MRAVPCSHAETPHVCHPEGRPRCRGRIHQSAQARRILPGHARWPERGSVTQAGEGPSPRSFLASLSHLCQLTDKRGRGDPRRALNSSSAAALRRCSLRSAGDARAHACSPLQRAFAVPAAGFIPPVWGSHRRRRSGPPERPGCPLPQLRGTALRVYGAL
jgi:hypothetical protein